MNCGQTQICQYDCSCGEDDCKGQWTLQPCIWYKVDDGLIQYGYTVRRQATISSQRTPMLHSGENSELTIMLNDSSHRKADLKRAERLTFEHNYTNLLCCSDPGSASMDYIVVTVSPKALRSKTESQPLHKTKKSRRILILEICRTMDVPSFETNSEIFTYMIKFPQIMTFQDFASAA